MTDLDLDAIRARVQAGADWLDREGPGWANRIDLDVLNIRFSCDCILGQIGAPQEWDFYQVARDFELTIAQCAELGLHGSPESPVDDYEALTDAWRDLITVRRAELAGTGGAS